VAVALAAVVVAVVMNGSDGLSPPSEAQATPPAQAACDPISDATTKIAPTRDVVVGPLVLIGARRTPSYRPDAFDRQGFKIPVTLPEGMTATLTVPESLRGRVGLVFSLRAQDAVLDSGMRGADSAVRFSACEPDGAPGRSGWGADSSWTVRAAPRSLSRSPARRRSAGGCRSDAAAEPVRRLMIRSALTPEQELRALVRETDSAPLSTAVPEAVREACQSAAEKSFVTVVCPRVVPAGQVGVSHTDKGVLLPRRTTLGIPGEDGERGEYRFRGSRRLYVLEFRSGGGLGNGHWLVGGGDPDDLAGEFLRTSDPSETPAERRYVRRGAHRIAVRHAAMS
jgi:hypothetical protein